MNVFVAKLVGGLVAVLLIGLLVSFPVMLLWNACLVPAVTVLQPVGWLQMWGIMIVCAGLFQTSVSMKN